MKLDHFTRDSLLSLLSPCAACGNSCWVKRGPDRVPCPACRDENIQSYAARNRIADRNYLNIKRKP